MRRRKKKDADKKLLSYSNLVIDNPNEYKGKWRKLFNNNNPIYVELGTGRGKFITTLAENNKDINFIGIEIKEEILLKAVEKADKEQLNNIKFIWGNIESILDFFIENEIDRLYINFCDPWPKKRWAKRRLTNNKFLIKYNKILKDNSEIHLKTDNEKLFGFSLNEFSDCNYKLKNISLNLNESDFNENITTEYEERFLSLGMKIFRLEAINRKTENL